MKTGIVLLSLCYPFLLVAQTDSGQGIHFGHGEAWQQVLTRAKIENKYLFVDCFTTWCAPCKKMEKEIYPLQNVGDVYNEKFICVKMQMDTSADDNDGTKSLYADAHYIGTRYKVEAYPTYLFFTPDGKLLSRSEGVKEPDDFIALANEVTDSSKNYYTLLAAFNANKTNLIQTSWLARQALLLGDTAASNEIAKSYTLRLSKDSLFSKPNLEFMHEFTKSSKDIGFGLFYGHAKRVDSIMEDDTYAEGLVHPIIYREMVLPELNKIKQLTKSEPKWNSIQSTVQKKYNTYYARRVITAAKVSWADHNNNIKEYTKYLVEYQDKYGSKTNHDFWTSFALNNYAWEIFQNSDSREELNHALAWSARAVLMAPGANWMDTYANLLYKLGRKEEALAWEEVAVKLWPNNKDIQGALEKMKKDEPTWPVSKK